MILHSLPGTSGVEPNKKAPRQATPGREAGDQYAEPTESTENSTPPTPHRPELQRQRGQLCQHSSTHRPQPQSCPAHDPRHQPASTSTAWVGQRRCATSARSTRSATRSRIASGRCCVWVLACARSSASSHSWSCPGFVDGLALGTFVGGGTPPFELLRREVTECGMAAAPVVEHLDVLEDSQA